MAVFALENGRYALLGEFGLGEPVHTRVLDGLELDPARVFAERRYELVENPGTGSRAVR